MTRWPTLAGLPSQFDIVVDAPRRRGMMADRGLRDRDDHYTPRPVEATMQTRLRHGTKESGSQPVTPPSTGPKSHPL